MATTWRAGLRRLWSSVATRGQVPHRPTFTTSLFAALLAVGLVLGFVAFRPTDQSTRGALPPGSSTTTTPRHVTTTVPPTTTQTASPPTTPPTTTAAAAPPTGPCTRSEVEVSVSVGGSAGITDVTTVLHDLTACVWQPVTVSGYPCPDTIAVVDADGRQVWPAPGQGEQCSTPATEVLTPGQTLSLSAAWNNQVPSGGGTTAAPPGRYAAVGTWSWATVGGQPDQASQSEPFSLS